MRQAGLSGIYRRRRRGCTIRDPAAEPHPDLVSRQFRADAPDRLWVTEVTQHPASEGWLYCAILWNQFVRF